MDAQRQSGIRVLLAGATGLVGRHCLNQLLADESIAAVIAVTRRPLERTHPKLDVRVVNFEYLRQQAGAMRVDAALCCLGTTHRAAGSPEAFAKVDHIYVAELAKLAANAGASCFVLVSSLLADANSPVFYHRVKGRAEAAINELHFKTVHLLRPSLLLGERAEPRPIEDWSRQMAPLWSLFAWGPFSRYRPIPAEIVAAKMVALAKDDQEGVHIHYFNN